MIKPKRKRAKTFKKCHNTATPVSTKLYSRTELLHLFCKDGEKKAFGISSKKYPAVFRNFQNWNIHDTDMDYDL